MKQLMKLTHRSAVRRTNVVPISSNPREKKRRWREKKEEKKRRGRRRREEKQQKDHLNQNIRVREDEKKKNKLPSEQQQTTSKRVKLIGLKASQLNGRMGWTTQFIEEGEGKGRFKVLLDGTDEPREGNFWCVFFVVALFWRFGCCSLVLSPHLFYAFFFFLFFLSLSLHQAEKLLCHWTTCQMWQLWYYSCSPTKCGTICMLQLWCCVACTW